VVVEADAIIFGRIAGVAVQVEDDLDFLQMVEEMFEVLRLRAGGILERAGELRVPGRDGDFMAGSSGSISPGRSKRVLPYRPWASRSPCSGSSWAVEDLLHGGL